MLNSVLIDSGPLIALFDKDDFFHKKLIRFLKNNTFRLVSTLPVLTEVSHMLDFSLQAQVNFLEWVLREGVIIQEINSTHIPRIIELTKKYRDLPMDFADASLVITSELTGIKEIISIDSDFDIYRLPKKEMIKNIFQYR